MTSQLKRVYIPIQYTYLVGAVNGMGNFGNGSGNNLAEIGFLKALASDVVICDPVTFALTSYSDDVNMLPYRSTTGALGSALSLYNAIKLNAMPLDIWLGEDCNRLKTVDTSDLARVSQAILPTATLQAAIDTGRAFVRMFYQFPVVPAVTGYFPSQAI